MTDILQQFHATSHNHSVSLPGDTHAVLVSSFHKQQLVVPLHKVLWNTSGSIHGAAAFAVVMAVRLQPGSSLTLEIGAVGSVSAAVHCSARGMRMTTKHKGRGRHAPHHNARQWFMCSKVKHDHYTTGVRRNMPVELDDGMVHTVAIVMLPYGAALFQDRSFVGFIQCQYSTGEVPELRVLHTSACRQWRSNAVVTDAVVVHAEAHMHLFMEASRRQAWKGIGPDTDAHTGATDHRAPLAKLLVDVEVAHGVPSPAVAVHKTMGRLLDTYAASIVSARRAKKPHAHPGTERPTSHMWTVVASFAQPLFAYRMLAACTQQTADVNASLAMYAHKQHVAHVPWTLRVVRAKELTRT